MIREMHSDDLDEVLKIEQQCFTNYWNHKQFLYELHDNEFAFLYVLLKDEKIIGFIDFWITFEQCQLAQIAIAKSYQGKGYSSKLMELMIKKAEAHMAESISLEVRVSNVVAFALYKKFNFIEMNKREGYYNDGEDAIVMVRPLGGNW